MCNKDEVMTPKTEAGYQNLSEVRRPKKKCDNFNCECQGEGHEESK